MKAVCVECKQDSFDHLCIETDQMNEYKSRVELFGNSALGRLYYGKYLNKKNTKTINIVLGWVNTALHIVFSLYVVAKKLGVSPQWFRDSTKKLIMKIAQLFLQWLRVLFLRLWKWDITSAWDSDYFFLKEDNTVNRRWRC